MDSARALIARGWGVSLVSRCLRVSRAQLHVILRRTDDWMDGRRSRHTDDTDVLLRIHHVIGELPTYGYRRVWALLRRQAELDGGFAPIFPDICYHLTHYKPAAADIPVASDNPAHYADAIRYNARTPLQGSLLPLTRLVWA